MGFEKIFCLFSLISYQYQKLLADFWTNCSGQRRDEACLRCSWRFGYPVLWRYIRH